MLKKIFHRLGLIILFLLCYMILGATLPFIRAKKISEESVAKYENTQFKSDTLSVDRASVIETSKDALDVRLYMIDQAVEKIALSSFSIKNDRACLEITSALYAAAKRGVKVQIIADGFTGLYDMKLDPMYYALASHPNVEIRYYNIINPLLPWNGNGRLHDKYLLIDDSMLVLGGRNVSNYFLGTYNTRVLSYDRDIFVYNTASKTSNKNQSVIFSVWDYFETVWSHKDSKQVFDLIPFYKKNKTKEAKELLVSTYETLKKERADLFSSDNFLTSTVPTNKITLLSNPINITKKEPVIWYALLDLMKNAEERVTIQMPYVVCNELMYNDLKETAINVPETTLFINSLAGGDNVMASSDYTKNRDKVIATGVNLWEFQGDHSMHDKSILIDDDLSVIGSFNFDMRSVYLDTEVMLVVHGKEFNEQLSAYTSAMLNESLYVQKDGSYAKSCEIKPLEISPSKKRLYSITSVIFQLFRYLL